MLSKYIPICNVITSTELLVFWSLNSKLDFWNQDSPIVLNDQGISS